MKNLFIFTLSVFLAMNMGVSGFATSFATSIGSHTLSERKALLFFTFFVLAGSILFGMKVAKSIGTKIVDFEPFTQEVLIIIFISCSLSLFLANIFGIPQSTSMITVGSIVGTGLFFKSLNFSFIFYLLSVWCSVSFFAYLLTYIFAKKIYPPRATNLHLYERFFYHKDRLKKWIFFTNCLSAFSIGTNNVANIVGPLLATGLAIPPSYFFTGFSLFFGLGAFFLGRKASQTVSSEIVPLGLVSASLVGLTVSIIIFICSLFGLPAPYVQYASFSLLALHTVKEEKTHILTIFHPITLKVLKIWLITALSAVGTSYTLLTLVF